MKADEICFLPAHELVRHIRARELSALEVMDAHLAQTERVNPAVNAIVTYLPELARGGAQAVDVALARGDDPGPLAGLPVDPEVTETLKAQRRVFADLGCLIEDATPDLRDADEIFQVMCAWNFELSYGQLLKSRRSLMKDMVIWNIEEGARLTGPQVGAAESKRTQLFHRMREFMGDYDFLVAPVHRCCRSTSMCLT